jgi:apolipoprotein N-acyltransferase
MPARRWRALAVAGGGGVLYFLGYVGWGVWPLITIFLVPFWRALEQSRPLGLGVSALVGLVFGGMAYAGGYPWLWRLVEFFLGGNLFVGAILWLGYGAWFALGFVAYALLFQLLRRRGWSLAAAGIPPLLAVEWLQPQIFPVYSGAALVLAPPLVQIADLGGPLLLSAVVGALNAATYSAWAWLRGERKLPLVPGAAAAVLVLLVLGYGYLRTAGIARESGEASALRVGLVQANLGLMEKRTQGVLGHRRHLEQTRELLADGPLDLIVWPETAYVRGLRRPLPLDGQPIRDDITVPLLFGGTSVWEDGGRRVSANSALLVAADGAIRDAYDKNLLIPLAEFAPFAGIVPQVAAFFPHVQDFRAADATPPLRLGALRIATPICYEAVRPDFVRRMVREARPHLIVTLANDAWFGDSQEPWIHLALTRLRAVEHRVWLVRATNSGVSAVVDSAGRVVARTGLLTRENLRAAVYPREARTLYTRLGDWPGAIAVALTVLGLTFRRGTPRTDKAFPIAPSKGDSLPVD